MGYFRSLLQRTFFLFVVPLVGCNNNFVFTKWISSNSLNSSSSSTSIPAPITIPISSPIDWWKFDQSSGPSATDSAGSHSGTLLNGASWIAGETGNAISVGGPAYPTTYSTAGAVSFPTNLPSTFTLYFWVKPNGFGTGPGAEDNFILGGENYQQNGFRSAFSDLGMFRFWTTESGGSLTLLDPQATPVGVWTQFVVSYQNGFANLYRNGNLVASAIGTYVPSTANMGIDTGIGGVNTFWGAVDDLRIYSQALSPSNIASGQYSLGTFGSASNPLQNTFTPPNKAAVQPSYFGMTIHNLTGLNNSGQTPFPTFPIQTLRFWDVAYWAQIEPSEGVFNWNDMDGIISIAHQNNVSDFIFTLGHVPTWASSNPGDNTCSEGAGSCDYPNMSAFTPFLTAVVQRYCGTVKYYESWNEPDGSGFWNGTNAQMLSIASQAYSIIKNPANCGCTNGACSPGGGVNPNQVILAPVSSVGQYSLSWLSSYLASVGGSYPYADIAGFHGYGYSGSPEGIIQGANAFQQLISQYGLGSVPIWNTETSWGTSTTSNSTVQAEQAAWLMRYYISQATSAVSRVVWYAYDNCAWGTMWGAACDPSNGTPIDSWTGVRQTGTAYGTLENWLIGSTLDRCEVYQNGLWACLLEKNNYTGWVVWSSNASSLTISVPAKMTDFRNSQNLIESLSATMTVGQSPILIEN